MRNIQITILQGENILHEYISDIIPNVGDDIEHNQVIYQITKRIYIANNNRIKLIVGSPYTMV